MIRDAKKQECRRRGWVCIFPTVETWNTYGALLEFGSSNNLILHEHLFPGMIRKPANKIRPRFKDNKKRSKSAGQSTFEKKLATTESFENKFNLSESPRALSPGELRVAQYEKHLEKGHKTSIKTKNSKDLEKFGKQTAEKKARSATLREKLIRMIESGLQLSEYQARKAFTVYLLCILHKLSDFNEDTEDSKQIEVVLKILQKVYFISTVITALE